MGNKTNVGTVIVNPHYVARLVGVVALARDLDQQDDFFDSIDFINNAHVSILVEELIQPEYFRMTEECRHVTKESLRYLLNSVPGDAVSQLCDMTGLPEERIPIFLRQIWQTLFKGEHDALSPGVKYSKSTAPLRFDQVRFAESPSRSLEASLDALRARWNKAS